uniref:extracellular calcium-sensing receptor-like isoform X6 n=1 Tax=Myxine glutinosa TaxID=7769 RepID=UPI00358ED0C3
MEVSRGGATRCSKGGARALLPAVSRLTQSGTDHVSDPVPDGVPTRTRSQSGTLWTPDRSRRQRCLPVRRRGASDRFPVGAELSRQFMERARTGRAGRIIPPARLGSGPKIAPRWAARTAHLHLLLLYIRNVRFTNSLGEEQWFDENGDPPPRYELVNVKIDNRTSVLNVVGSFDLNKGLQVDLPQVWWNSECQEIPRSICSKPCMPGTRIVSLRSQPSCCFECVPCTSGEVSNITDSQECYPCPEGLWSNDKQDTCIPMHQEFLSFTEPLAIIMLTFALMGMLMTMAFIGLLYWTDLRRDVWMGNPAMSGTL